MRVAKDLDRHVALGENAIICGGVAAQLLRLAPEQNADAMAAEVKMPGDHKTVAGVVPPPAADRHRPGNAQSAEHVGHAAAGVLHQHQPREAELLDGNPIDLPRLLAGENDRWHGSVSGTRRVPFGFPWM